MYRSETRAFVLGALAALMWSPNFHALESLSHDGVSPLVVQFHFLFWASAALFVLVFLTGGQSSLSVVNRRETHFLLLAALGGYAFWVLRSLAVESAPSHARLMFYAAPLAVGLLSLLTQERPDARVVVGLLLGFAGCALIAQSHTGGAADSASFRGSVQALAAAGCWGFFTVLARPMVREEKVLPVAALVTGVGAACLLVTCLSTGDNVFSIRPAQIGSAMLAGVLTVGVMMACWLKCLAALPATVASPFWYLGMLFGVLWGTGEGGTVSTWWLLGGAALILLGIRTTVSGRGRKGTTLGDLIRG